MYNLAPDELDIASLQALLQQLIVPRPIALVSTADAAGNVNLSPFSFFNLVSANPPVCVFSPARRVRDNSQKDTFENIIQTGECVVNMVDYALAGKASESSAEFARGVNEFAEVGLTQLASVTVAPPRVAEAPAQLECKVRQVIPLGDGPGAGNLVIAGITYIHIDERVLGPGKQIDPLALDLVARLGGEWYCRLVTESLFRLPKPPPGRPG